MRSFKFYISMAMVVGLISLSSTSFAGERYNIDVESVKKAAKKSSWNEQAELEWNAKIKNNTDEIQTYEIRVNFLNSANEKIHEATKLVTFNPNETQIVTKKTSLKSSLVQDIYSGYVTISKVNEQALSARLDKNLNMSITRLSNESVLLAYTIKLKNNTDKSMTRNVTVAFFDENNNHVKSETSKASFNAGESKMITDTVELRASDAERIATGYVTIN